jgi:cell wall-associated NlpC family hydrolase
VAASVTAQQLPVQHSSSGDGDSDADDSTSDAESGASAPAAPSAPQQAPSVPQQPAYSSGGSYSCSGLESLWVQAGGSSSAAFTAAEIAMAESGGNPNAVSPTNDYGLWQINGSHGSMATFSPMGNARAAVSISGDGSNWSPWTTYTSGAYQGKCSGSVSTTAQITPDRVVSAPSRSSSAAATAYAWALTQEGKWYSYGTAGPSTYDCSGLVMDAYQHAGIDLPRTTYGMLASAHLVRESVPHQGDLAFYSSGHVELYAYSGTTFGAHSSGQQVGFIHEWTTPEYYAVR